MIDCILLVASPEDEENPVIWQNKATEQQQRGKSLKALQ